MKFKIEVEESDDECIRLQHLVNSSGEQYRFSVQEHPGGYLRRLLNSISPVVQGYAVKVGTIESTSWEKSSDEHCYLFYRPREGNNVEIAPIIDWTSAETEKVVSVGQTIDDGGLDFEYIAPFGRVVLDVSQLLEMLIESASQYLDIHKQRNSANAVCTQDYQAVINRATEFLNYYEQNRRLGESAHESDVRKVEQFLSLEESTPDYFTEEYVIDNDLVPEFVTLVLESGDAEYVDTQISRLIVDNKEIAKQAIATLAENPDERTKQALLPAVYRNDPQLTPEALHLLAQMDGEDIKREARGLLVEESIGEKSEHPSVRQAAADALGTLGGTEAREALQKAAEDDTDPAVRETARNALYQLQD